MKEKRQHRKVDSATHAEPTRASGSPKPAQTTVLEGVLHLMSPGRVTIGALASPQLKGRDEANALATHDNNACHLNLACSVRRRRTMGICLALAFASWLKKLLVSPDQRPPTSPAKTTNRVRARCPTSSGHATLAS